MQVEPIRLLDSPPGTYIVTVTDTGYQTFAIGVSVEANSITTQNVSLLPNPGQILGIVFDEAQAPLPNAVVQLLQNGVIIATVVSNAEGQFLFQNLAPGNYVVRITATGFQTLSLSALVVSNQTTSIDPNLPQIRALYKGPLPILLLLPG